jgi:hypothetical protein
MLVDTIVVSVRPRFRERLSEALGVLDDLALEAAAVVVTQRHQGPSFS